MSDSPNAMFRELFVELPRHVFEALQGIGEQAVREAQKPVLRRPLDRLLTTSGLEWFASAIRARYGWRESAVEIVADRDSWRFIVRLACGHRHRIEVEAETLFAEPADKDRACKLVDRFDRCAHVRSCYCVPREASA